MNTKSVTGLAICDEKGGIAKDGKQHLFNRFDLQLFRHLTIGRTVVMGRKTFENLENHFSGEVLPYRHKIILTNNNYINYSNRFSKVKRHEVKSGLFELRKMEGTPIIIGGETVYRQAFDVEYLQYSKFYLTKILKDTEADQHLHLDILEENFKKKTSPLSGNIDNGKILLYWRDAVNLTSSKDQKQKSNWPRHRLQWGSW